ncbi:hypothetical protein [Streptomyces chartreusis]
MWSQERNGSLTPQTATPKMQVAVCWRCAAGHECAVRRRRSVLALLVFAVGRVAQGRRPRWPGWRRGSCSGRAREGFSS